MEKTAGIGANLEMPPIPSTQHPSYDLRGINPERLDAIYKFAGKEILDVGCGSGAYVLFLANRYKIRGMDYQKFDSWNACPDLFSISDAQVLACGDNSVDTILSFETLEHLPDPQHALSEYFRVCRSNVILTVPNCTQTQGMKGSGFIFNHWIDRTHLNFWDMNSISKLVSDAGFQIQNQWYINQINLGVVAMEALGLHGWFGRIGARIFRCFQRKKYFMTCLIIARKTG